MPNRDAAIFGELRPFARRAFFHFVDFVRKDHGVPAIGRDASLEFRNAIREQPKFRYVMTAGPDDLLIELFQCHEPQRWQLKP